MLQFQAFDSAVDGQFWETLAKNKMDIYMLSNDCVKISGYYRPGSLLETLAIPARLSVSSASFLNTHDHYATMAPGLLKNTNTLEEFKELDKNKFLKEAGFKLWESIKSGDAIKNPSQLSLFAMITFADLKKYKFYYWFAFPAIVPKIPFELIKGLTVNSLYSKEELVNLRQVYTLYKTNFPEQSGFFLLKPSVNQPDSFEIGPLEAWDSFWNGIPADQFTVGFVDPSGLELNPGWPLRNFLMLIQHHWKLHRIKVFCFREQKRNDISNSIVLEISLNPENGF